MAHARSTAPSHRTSSSRSRKASASAQPDAIELLVQDHEAVKKLFKQYSTLCAEGADDDERQALAMKICALLMVHTSIEEEIFYPMARRALEEQSLLDEAEVEHDAAKELISQIEEGSPSEDQLYDAKVHVLGEYIDHHVKEEEKEMFPKVKKAKVDLEALGQEMQQRKSELMPEEETEEEQGQPH